MICEVWMVHEGPATAIGEFFFTPPSIPPLRPPGRPPGRPPPSWFPNTRAADRFSALARLRSGEVSAVVAMAGRPAAEFAGIRAAEGLRLVPVPFFAPLQAEYYPASLSAADYPGLIGEGERVDTVAAGAVLVATDGRRSAARKAAGIGAREAAYPQEAITATLHHDRP